MCLSDGARERDLTLSSCRALEWSGVSASGRGIICLADGARGGELASSGAEGIAACVEVTSPWRQAEEWSSAWAAFALILLTRSEYQSGR